MEKELAPPTHPSPHASKSSRTASLRRPSGACHGQAAVATFGDRSPKPDRDHVLQPEQPRPAWNPADTRPLVPLPTIGVARKTLKELVPKRTTALVQLDVRLTPSTGSQGDAGQVVASVPS